MTTDASHKISEEMCSLVHPECVVCSDNNTKGLHLEYNVSEDGSVRAAFECEKALEGYPGIVHGGVISAILDGAMGHCMFARGQTAVTIEMTTRFRSPVVTGDDAVVSARITRFSHPLYLLEAEIIQNGKVRARAKAKFYDQPELMNNLD